MKHEPRPAIYMEKQLGWARKLGGVESLGIFKAGQTVLTRLMETKLWHQFTSSMGREFRKETMASVHLDSRYFSFSIYATDAFQAATQVLELRGSESE